MIELFIESIIVALQLFIENIIVALQLFIESALQFLDLLRQRNLFRHDDRFQLLAGQMDW